MRPEASADRSDIGHRRGTGNPFEIHPAGDVPGRGRDAELEPKAVVVQLELENVTALVGLGIDGVQRAHRRLVVLPLQAQIRLVAIEGVIGECRSCPKCDEHDPNGQRCYHGKDPRP